MSVQKSQMGIRRLVLLDIHAPKASEVLAAGELAVEHAMRSKQPHAVVLTWPEEAVVYGLYEAVRDNESTAIYRRITGGHKAYMAPGQAYIAVALPWRKSLEGLASIALGIASCAGGTYGVTVFGETGYIEVLGARSVEEARQCLLEALNVEKSVKMHVPRTSLQELATLFESQQWREYIYHRGDAEAERRREGGYWIRISIETTDGYVTGYWLTGVFFSAPPTEVYNVLNSLRGARFHELMLYNIELAIEKRIQFLGITSEDFMSAVRELYDAVGIRYYTR
ncbi:hypothetical protein [Pyrodictium delaneyi]|uniref:hypothetical protein n=1 Tax=Pyrodictium delaneyi TaxID=1273541 RepID=UPI00117A400C|nr:hypothetical protein [Pyrodictium delaneyi]